MSLVLHLAVPVSVATHEVFSYSAHWPAQGNLPL